MDALARVLHRYGADPIEEELWVTETHDWEGKPVRVVGRSEEESLSKIKPALLQKAKAMQQEALETTGEEYDVVSGEDLGRVFHWAHYATEEEALTSSSGPWERLHQVTYRVSLTEGMDALSAALRLLAQDELLDAFYEWAKVNRWSPYFIDAVFNDERAGASGQELWDELRSITPGQPTTIDPWSIFNENVWSLSRLPDQELIEQALANAEGRRLRVPEMIPQDVESRPGRHREYFQLDWGTAKPSIVHDNIIMWGAGRYLAALLRNDDKLNVVVVDSSPDQAAMAETWLKENYPDLVYTPQHPDWLW